MVQDSGGRAGPRQWREGWSKTAEEGLVQDSGGRDGPRQWRDGPR